jgi:NitT/TauT family transport system permease protein
MATVLSLCLLVALWAVAAAYASDEALFPSPWRVGQIIWAETASGELPRHLAATLFRVAAAFVVAMAIGCAIGVWMGRKPGVNLWGDPWLVFLLNLPALVTIVLCYLWIGLTEAAAIAAVAINKIPMVAVMMREGARALDPALDDMARAYRMTPMARLAHVTAPQLAPHFAAAGRAGVALIWKIVLVVEFLGRSDGIGFQIHLWFQLFEVGHILAYALSFIGVMLAVEYLALQPWERRTSRWRDAG